jgi:iron(III) transport system ATP-binding protein
LRIAAGIDRADAGEVRLDGAAMQGAGRFVPPEDRHVGLMFQDYALFPHLTALGNVLFGLDRRPKRERLARAMSALAQVGLERLANAYPHVLSGGEQQRVALARAMAPDPKLMLMDEPFSGLDERLRDEVRERTMTVLRAANASAVIVTHDPEEAMLIADRIVLLRQGKVVQDAKPDEIYANPIDELAAAFFAQHTALEGVARNGAVETPAGPLPAAHPDGARLRVLVRPEAIVAGAENGRAAKVLKLRRVGPDTWADFALVGVDAPVLRARLREADGIVQDSIVPIGLDPRRTLIFPIA